MTQFKYLAQSAVPPTDSFGGFPAVNLGPNDVYRILAKFATWMFAIFILLAVVFVIFAAFRFLTAGGEQSKIKDANKAFWFAIVALVAAFGATAVIALVNQLFLGP